MKICHRAATAGLALALAIGAVHAPAIAFAEPAETPVEEQSADVAASLPDGYDKQDFYQEAPAARALSLTMMSSRGTSLVDVTEEMRYFTLYESGKNYDQGFSYGDGYNALGYYQFDRRYSLVSFLQFCYDYDPATFSMFKAVLDRAGELSDRNVPMHDGTRLTEVGQLAENAWHAAYKADPETFAALQDTFAYNSYYAVTERWLATQGIDMSGRADCVKGLVWSLTNLFGTGGVRKYLTAAELDNSMTDREFVNAIVDSLPSSLAAYNSNTQYHKSWINRYEKERTSCLAYIAEDEAAAGESAPGGSTTEPDAGDSTPSEPEVSGNGDAVLVPGGDTTSGDAGQQPDGGSSDDDATGQQPGSGSSEDDAIGQQPGGSGSSDSAGSGADSTTGSSDGSTGGTTGGAQDDGDSDGSTTTPPPASNGGLGGTSSSDGEKDDGQEDASGSSGSSNSSSDDGSSTGDASKDGVGSDKTGAGTDGSKGTGTGSSDTSKNGTGKDAAGSGATSEQPGEGMPQTGDLAMIAVLASGSLAAFGATAVYAGKVDLKGIRGKSSGEDE